MTRKDDPMKDAEERREFADRFHTFKVGDRVVLARDVDRFPDFIARAGMVGTVDSVEIDGSLAIKMDETIDGCEEWDNCICWYDDQCADIVDDLAMVATND